MDLIRFPGDGAIAREEDFTAVGPGEIAHVAAPIVEMIASFLNQSNASGYKKPTGL
jgi:hypothetical protein